LKGKTTQTNPDLVASDFVKVLVELLKLHKEVYITADLFFVKKILFFLTLSYKICFMAINHLTDRTVVQIAIHGIQGDLPVLSPMWLSHYNGTSGQGIHLRLQVEQDWDTLQKCCSGTKIK
jgi:hypothetical protein